jgi:hypothetical protein
MSSSTESNGTFFLDPAQPAPSAVPAPEPLAAVPAPAPVLASLIDESTPMRDVPLGTLIFRAGLLAEEQLEDALQEGMKKGKRLGEVLLERGWLHERDLGRLLAGQKGLPFVEIRASDAEPAALERLPEEKARMQNALPLRFEDGHLVVAVADPSNELVIENLRRSIGSEPRLVVAPHGDLMRAIAEAYAPAVALEAAPQPEPTVQPEPALELEPTLQQEQPITPPVVTALPTVIPPAETREVEPTLLEPLAPEPAVEEPLAEPAPSPEPVVETFQPPLEAPMTEPVAETIEQPPAVEPMTPAAPPEATPAPVLEQPAPQLETPVVPEAVTPLAPPPVETAAAPLEPPAPVTPLQPAEPVEREAAPEAPPEPLLVPPAAEQHVETVAPAFAGVDAVAPAALPAEAPAVTPEPAPGPATLHVVLIRLREGEVFEVGTFESAAEATTCAQDVIRQITTSEGEATWPFFADRYLRPDTIVSVDLLEESADKWLGSAARTRWASGEE